MKKKAVIIAATVLVIAAAVGVWYYVQNKSTVYTIECSAYAPTEEPGVQQSFVATVLDETTEYMIVEPAEDEDERQLGDKIMIDYGKDHADFLYGIGRKVVIYYYGATGGEDLPAIVTDDISTEGFRDFELSVKKAETKQKHKISDADELKTYISFGQFSDTNLYYYGLDEVSITVDNKTMPLKKALKDGKMTLNGIVARANSDAESGKIQMLSYDDGGSSMYMYEDFTIIKYHTLEGNRDVYIGSSDMGIDVASR